MSDHGFPDTLGVVDVDRRSRVPLGRLARHRRYQARVERDGTIVLVPVDAGEGRAVAPRRRPDPEMGETPTG